MPIASVRLEGCLGDRPFLEAWLASHYFGLSCSEIGMLLSIPREYVLLPPRFVFVCIARQLCCIPLEGLRPFEESIAVVLE